MDDDEILVVLSTFPDQDSAAQAGRTLVEESLAACAQIETGSLRSLYRWQGELHDEIETLLRLKSLPHLRARLVQRLSALHPYEVPQIVALDARANAPYAQWTRRQCDPDGPLRG